MDAALCLVGPCPAALAAGSRLGARRAADRLITLVVQRVIRQVALVDAPPQVPVRPVRQRVVLPQTALGVAFDRLRLRARLTLLAANAGDPALRALKRALQRRDLSVRAAVLGTAPRVLGVARVLHLDPHAEALLERAPRLQRLLEQHAGVDRHEPHRLGGWGLNMLEPQQLVDQHRLLLLEGAQQHGSRAVARRLAQRVRQAECRIGLGGVLRYVALHTAHAHALCLSLKNLCSHYLYRALALAADHFERDIAVPVDERVHRLQPEVDGHRQILDDPLELARADALGEVVPLLALLAVGLVVADPALDRVRHPLGGQAQLQPRAEPHLAAFEHAADMGYVGGDRVLADFDRRAGEPDACDVMLAAAVPAAADLHVQPARELVGYVHRLDPLLHGLVQAHRARDPELARVRARAGDDVVDLSDRKSVV